LAGIALKGGYLPPGSITHIVIVIPWWHPRTLGCWRAGDGAIVALWLLAAVREWPGRLDTWVSYVNGCGW